MIQKEEVVRIGYFAKPHGIKGELSLITDYDLLEDIDDPYLVCEMDGILVPFYVESFRYKNNTVTLVKLEGVDDSVLAKQFVNMDVLYPANRMKASSIESPSWQHFIGYVMEDRKHGKLGMITDVDTTTPNTFFQVDYRGKELLVPVVDELVDSIDHEGKKIVLLLPEGILYINEQ